MFVDLICRVWGHKVNLRRVWDDGISIRGRCRHCNNAMIHDGEDWRMFDPQEDFNAHRRSHPRYAPRHIPEQTKRASA